MCPNFGKLFQIILFYFSIFITATWTVFIFYIISYHSMLKLLKLCNNTLFFFFFFSINKRLEIIRNHKYVINIVSLMELYPPHYHKSMYSIVWCCIVETRRCFVGTLPINYHSLHNWSHNLPHCSTWYHCHWSNCPITHRFLQIFPFLGD